MSVKYVVNYGADLNRTFTSKDKALGFKMGLLDQGLKEVSMKTVKVKKSKKKPNKVKKK